MLCQTNVLNVYFERLKISREFHEVVRHFRDTASLSFSSNSYKRISRQNVHFWNRVRNLEADNFFNFSARRLEP